MNAPLQIRSVQDQIYNYMLSASYSTAWVYNPGYALYKDADIFEVVMRDAAIASSIDRFQNSVVRPYRVEAPKGSRNPQSKTAARIMEDAIRQSSLFDDMRKRLALGRVRGRAYEYPKYQVRMCALGGFPEMEWMVPTEYENIDHRRVRWVPRWGDGTPGSYTGVNDSPLSSTRFLYSVRRRTWLSMSSEFSDALLEDIYPAEEARLLYGRGCEDQFYIYAYYKAIFLEKMSQGIDRWANSMLIAKIDSSRLSSLPKNSAAIQQSMATVLQTARSEHVIVLDKADEIEAIEAGSSGQDMCLKAIEYCDQSIERLLNGSIRPAGHAQGNGARAASETESDTSESFYQAYRQHQDEIITRDVIGFLWNHPVNRMNMLKLGLGIAEKPHFSSEQIKKKTPLESMQLIAAARQAGIPLLKSEVYEDIEKTEPEPGQDVFDGAMATGDGSGMDLDSAGGAGAMSPEKKDKEKKDERDHEVNMAKAGGQQDKPGFGK